MHPHAGTSTGTPHIPYSSRTRVRRNSTLVLKISLVLLYRVPALFRADIRGDAACCLRPTPPPCRALRPSLSNIDYLDIALKEVELIERKTSFGDGTSQESWPSTQVQTRFNGSLMRGSCTA